MGFRGLDPQRAKRVAELEAECRPLLGQEDGMETVQRLLAGRGVGATDSILVTSQLLGGGPGALGKAKTAVLGSAARSTERAHHGRFVTDLLTRLTGAPDVQVHESGDQ